MGALIHLELHTGDKCGAAEFLTQLLGWRADQVRSAAGNYLSLAMGPQLGGGIVDCGANPPQWLPYAAVDRVMRSTERAGELGAEVLVDPREGPTGWRSVIASPTGGLIGLWQPKAT